MEKCPMREHGCKGVLGEYHSIKKCVYIRAKAESHFNSVPPYKFRNYTYEHYQDAVKLHLFLNYNITNQLMVDFVTEQVTFCKFCRGNKASLTTTY